MKGENLTKGITLFHWEMERNGGTPRLEVQAKEDGTQLKGKRLKEFLRSKGIDFKKLHFLFYREGICLYSIE